MKRARLSVGRLSSGIDRPPLHLLCHFLHISFSLFSISLCLSVSFSNFSLFLRYLPIFSCASLYLFCTCVSVSFCPGHILSRVCNGTESPQNVELTFRKKMSHLLKISDDLFQSFASIFGLSRA